MAPRASSGLFSACARMVDDLLGGLMSGMDDDTLLVVSSDHGAMAQRSFLHLNEVFAAAGLTRKKADGYDFTSRCSGTTRRIADRWSLVIRSRHASTIVPCAA